MSRRAKWLLLLGLIACLPLAAQEASEHKEGEAAGHSEEVSPMWKWANFALLAVGLGYLMAKNLPGMFRARSEEIQKGITEAQQMKREAEQRAAEMDKRLNALGAEVETFRKQAATEMNQEGERIRKDTAEQIKKLEERAAAEIESAGKTQQRELKQYAANLALGLAEERVRARLDGNAEAGLVDGFVRDLDRQGSKN